MIYRNFKVESLLHVFLPVAIVFIWLSFIYKYDSFKLSILLVLAVLIYFVLAGIHHKLDKSLTKEAIIEYILLGSLAGLIVLGLQVIF